MEALLARIPAHSRRQAMDWSLVLASQQIEAWIESPETGSGWGLIVPADQFNSALEAIRLYRVENLRWHWPAKWDGLLFDWISLCWVLLLCVFYLLTSLSPGMESSGLMNGAKVSAGQWWRLFTATWLHADVAHLAGNSTLGLLLLGLAMGRFGAGIGLLAAYLAGVGGNVAVWLLWQGQSSLGASGVVMGSLGLLAVHSLSLRPRTFFATRTFLAGLLGGMMLFVLVGLSPGTDWRAHIGGFVCGSVGGAGLRLLSPRQAGAKWNWMAALLFAATVIFPWLFSIRAATAD